jgi:hypothetical protein
VYIALWVGSDFQNSVDQGTFGDISTVLVLFGIDVGPGWSFYLVAAAGGGSLLLRPSG